VFPQPRAVAVTLSVFSASVLSSCVDPGTSAPVGATRSEVVYGEDDRREFFEVSDPVLRQRLARSTVAIVPAGRIDVSNPEQITFDVPSLGDDDGLCEGERYREQPVIASCSGTLVDRDLLLTAGHCVDSAAGCDDQRFIFDLYYESATQLASVSAADVYRCRELVTRFNDGDADYALIQLDRPVPEPHGPAPVRLENEPLAQGSGVSLVGFPRGIPAKVAAGGRVIDGRDRRLDFFVSTIDAFSSNSGSGVFDERGDLAGILARGEDDYVWEGSCRRVHVVPESDDLTEAEESTYLARAVAGLCATGWGSDLCGPTGGWCRPCAGVLDCPEGWACRSLDEDSGVTWCAPPCEVNADCADGHRCEPSGYCKPESEGQCSAYGIVRRNSCGRRLGITPCERDTVCRAGACVAADAGNVCETAMELEPQSAVLRGQLGEGFGNDHRGSCGGDGRERVWGFELTERTRLIATATGFDSVLYLRRGCAAAGELSCNDDSEPPGAFGSRLDQVLEPGRYALFLDAYELERASYRLELVFSPLAPPRSDAGASGDGGALGGADAGVEGPDAGSGPTVSDAAVPDAAGSGSSDASAMRSDGEPEVAREGEGGCAVSRTTTDAHAGWALALALAACRRNRRSRARGGRPTCP
jgi:V8-like Glu-specific endopeptidase